jgi:Tfp pilus assembly protein PilX
MEMIKKFFKFQSRICDSRRGMTLFISISIVSILLMIIYSLVSIVIKGTQFAATGRESQYAYYAAESGLECAIYWDTEADAFATSSGAVTIRCANQDRDNGLNKPNIVGTTTIVSTRIGGGGDANPMSIFHIGYGGPCAIVTVLKYYSGPDLITHIKSRGYNTCNTSSSRRLERGVEAKY